jgi:hypothetical protein
MSIDPKDVSMVDVSGAGTMKTDGVSDDNKMRFDSPEPAGNEDAPVRRKSTLILTDDIDLDRMHIDDTRESSASVGSDGEVTGSSPAQVHVHDQTQGQTQAEDGSVGQQHSPEQQQQQQQQQIDEPPPNVTVPVEIKWVQGGEKVYVTGSFTGWRKMIGLVKQPDGTFLITLGLPVGTHRFRFVIDNELRFSDFLPTATDQMGNFVNYVEVTPDHIYTHLDQQNQQQQDSESPQQPPSQLVSRKSSISRTTTRTDSMWGLTNDDDDMGNGYSRYHEENCDAASPFRRVKEYISHIPPIFTDPKVMEQYYVAIDKQSKIQNGQQQAWLHPPQIPPHLEHVILNSFSPQDNNSGALPIPNHVVLNHLATTSIKHNILAVASVVRYKQKYVTQVLYAPLQQ